MRYAFRVDGKTSRAGMERAKHRQYSMCINVYSRSSLHSDEYLVACACPMNAVSFMSPTIRRASFRRPRVFLVPPFVLPLFLCLSYPHPLRPESCSCEFLHECKRRPGRLYELFQFTSTNCGSFLRFLSFFLSLPLSRAFVLPLSFPLFLFLSSPCT